MSDEIKTDEKHTDSSHSTEDFFGINGKLDCNCKLLSPESEETGIVYCSFKSTLYKNILFKLDRDLEIVRKRSVKSIGVGERANKLIALIEIIKHINLNGGFFPFEDVYEIFINHQCGLPDKKSFRSSILDPKDGIPVHIFQNSAGKSLVRYLVKKSRAFFLDKFLEHLKGKGNIPQCASRFEIHKTDFNDIVRSLDTEWDRKCVKVLFGCNMSKREMTKFGLKLDTIQKDIEDMQYYNIPPVRPRLIEFTDAGTGVGCNNYEVKFRDQELAWLHNSSLRMRVHLATDDQGQNEAERLNAYIGDALADGTALKSNYYDKYHGLSENDINDMTKDQLTEHEAKMVRLDAWCIVEDVVSKIHDEPGPGGCYMQVFKTKEPDEQFFYNTDFLNRWRKKGQRARSTLPGHEYFSAVEISIEKHYQIGELYFEYLKCLNDGIQCNWCTNSIDIGPRPDPIPKPVPGTNGHYKKIVDTPRLNADGKRGIPDEFQPRAQLKKLYNADKDLLNQPETITRFCDKYLVKETLCLEYLKHLADLDLRKRKRSDKRKKKPLVTKQPKAVKEADDNQNSDEHDESEISTDDDNDDGIIEEIDGSDFSDESDSSDEEVVICKSKDTVSNDNNEHNKITYVTKYGRKATKFQF